MPVKSLDSSVRKWPDKHAVHQAARTWSDREAKGRPELMRLGYCGSYARGDWGVGSDLDLVAVVSESPLPFETRNRDWDLNSLPVPAHLLIYTASEWHAIEQEDGRFIRMLRRETVWVFERRLPR